MQPLVTGMLLATLLAGPVALAGNSPDFTSAAQPGNVLLAASGGAGRQTIFLQAGRTIQAEGTERPGDRIRVETLTGRIALPSSQVLSIHRMDVSPGSASSPAPSDVYRGLTQQMTDRVRGKIQGQSRPAQAR